MILAYGGKDIIMEESININEKKRAEKESAQEIAASIIKLLESSKTSRDALIKALAENGYITKSNIPYRNKVEAERVRPIVDRMIANGKDVEFLYESYDGLYTPNTIRLMVFNTIAWLVHDSGEERYAIWREKIIIKTTPTGIAIKYRKSNTLDIDQMSIVEGGTLIANVVDAKEAEPAAWKESLHEFISNSKSGDVFEKRELSLSLSEVTEIETLFEGLGQSFTGAVLPNRIKLIHHKE